MARVSLSLSCFRSVTILTRSKFFPSCDLPAIAACTYVAATLVGTTNVSFAAGISNCERTTLTVFESSAIGSVLLSQRAG